MSFALSGEIDYKGNEKGFSSGFGNWKGMTRECTRRTQRLFHVILHTNESGEINFFLHMYHDPCFYCYYHYLDRVHRCFKKPIA